MAFDLRALLGLATPQHQQQGYTQAQMKQMTPVGQKIPQGMMDSFSPQTRQLAQIYQSNPMDPRVAHLDPAMFGYRPDQTVNTNPHTNIPFSHHQAPLISGPFAQQHSMGSNFSTPIQGLQNPGFTPLQGSRGVKPIQGEY